MDQSIAKYFAKKTLHISSYPGSKKLFFFSSHIIFSKFLQLYNLTRTYIDIHYIPLRRK